MNDFTAQLKQLLQDNDILKKYVAQMEDFIVDIMCVIKGIQEGEPVSEEIIRVFDTTISVEEFARIRAIALAYETLHGTDETLITVKVMDTLRNSNVIKVV